MSAYSLNDLGYILYYGEDPDAENLWDRVPEAGPAGNIAGEALRATSRLGYRYYNDGDYANVGYGKENCNPAAGFLIACTNAEIAAIVENLCDLEWQDSNNYEDGLYDLNWAVRDFVMSDPALWDEPADDMFLYDIPDYLQYEDEDDEDDYYW